MSLEKPGLAVEELLDGPRVHLALVHQIDDHARIQGTAARAHRQPVGRGEAHRRRQAASRVHRAHARTVAEMQHDRLPGGRPRIQPRKLGGDVFVRQAVKSVTLHAGIVELSRQRESLGHVRIRAVEGRVEASDLRDLR
jgi:hypothetical protein